MIKKLTLTFVAKFWWPMVCYILWIIVVDCVFTFEGTVLIAKIIERYDIDFSTII